MQKNIILPGNLDLRERKHLRDTHTMGFSYAGSISGYFLEQ